MLSGFPADKPSKQQDEHDFLPGQHLLPAKIECENFYQRLRTLEMKIDRIDAKNKRQQKSTSPPLS